MILVKHVQSISRQRQEKNLPDGFYPFLSLCLYQQWMMYHSIGLQKTINAYKCLSWIKRRGRDRDTSCDADTDLFSYYHLLLCSMIKYILLEPASVRLLFYELLICSCNSIFAWSCYFDSPLTIKSDTVSVGWYGDTVLSRPFLESALNIITMAWRLTGTCDFEVKSQGK